MASPLIAFVRIVMVRATLGSVPLLEEGRGGGETGPATHMQAHPPQMLQVGPVAWAGSQRLNFATLPDAFLFDMVLPIPGTA